MSLKEKFKSTFKGSLSNDKYQLKQLNHILPNSELFDPIFAFHQFQTGDDYIKIRYDKTKADQEGQKVKDKHIYANPFDPLVCSFLSLDF